MNKEYDNLVSKSKDNLVELPTGQLEFGDLMEFHRVVDFFASRYGLGGFKSLEEFAEMINQTDPVLITGLHNAGVDAENKKWGGDDEDDKPTSEQQSTPTYTDGGNIPKKPSDGFTIGKKKHKFMGSSGKVRNLLMEFGIGKDDLDKAKEKLSRRKIVLKDYSWVDSKTLKNMNAEEFHALLKDMNEQNNKSINFSVSDDMYRANQRTKHGR